MNNFLYPTVLGDFLQPGFPTAKVFSVFFLENKLVFTKTGSGGTDTAGKMRAGLGGFTSTAMIAGAIGTLVDSDSAKSRSDKASQMAALNADDMVKAHKLNFMLSYDNIKSVEIKGPNFAGELKVMVNADKTYKFRIDKQSKDSARYIEKIFNEYLPQKVIKK